MTICQDKLCSIKKHRKIIRSCVFESGCCVCSFTPYLAGGSGLCHALYGETRTRQIDAGLQIGTIKDYKLYSSNHKINILSSLLVQFSGHLTRLSKTALSILVSFNPVQTCQLKSPKGQTAV